MCAALLIQALPGAGFFYGSGDSITHQTSTTSSSSWSRGLAIPLSTAIRKPVAVLKTLSPFRSADRSPNALRLRDIESRRVVLRHNLRTATNLDAWRAAAIELDDIEGNDAWKLDTESAEYNYALVRSRLEQLEDARIDGDPKRMLFLIRTALTRHLGGMGNIQLYKHSHIGTKVLIEEYIRSALDTLAALLDLTQSRQFKDLSNRYLLEQTLNARQSFGRSALLLSGGGTFGMYHIGVTKCLWEQRLLPRIVSGASAGSIVSAVLCARTDDELPATIEELCIGDLEVFTKAGVDDNPLKQITYFLKSGALFDIANLTRIMKGFLGEITFQEAYNRTRRILNICVSNAGLYELPRLLNYVTSPNVIIWSAVVASCSVPFVFTSVPLLAKDPKTGEARPWNPSPQRWIDGSVDNDLPMTRLAEMFNVNHFIVSQVNPHVIPFLAREEDGMLQKEPSEAHVEASHGWLHGLATMAKDEVLHRMQVLSEVGILPNLMTKARSILSQRYSGDITILPEVPYSQFPLVLKNPTPNFMAQAVLRGERATWPKLSRVQNHCAIELALDDTVQQLRARIAFSPSQVDLRLNTIARPISRAGSEVGQKKSRRTGGKQLRFNHRVDDNERNEDSAEDSGGPNNRLQAKSPSLGALARYKEALSQHTAGIHVARRRKLAPSEDDRLAAKRAEDDVADDSDDQSDQRDSDDEIGLTNAFAGSGQLFPIASQPPTPWWNSSRRSYFGASTPSLPSPVALHHSITMTAASNAHGEAALLKDSTPQVSDRTQSPSAQLGRRRANSGSSAYSLEVDLSGTRGMVLRKKRSVSSLTLKTPD